MFFTIDFDMNILLARNSNLSSSNSEKFIILNFTGKFLIVIIWVIIIIHERIQGTLGIYYRYIEVSDHQSKAEYNSETLLMVYVYTDKHSHQ